MIPFQIDSKTYFIPEQWYWDNIDKYDLKEFSQLVISSSFSKNDLEETFDAEIKENSIIKKLKNSLKTDKTDRRWLSDNKDFFD